MKTLELGQYYGTEQYHSLKPLFQTVVTDGVNYVMKHDYSWFVTDSIAVIENPEDIKKLSEYLSKDKFLTVTLNAIDKDKIKMIIEDGNGHVLYIQKYDCIIADHDIPENQLKMYWIDGVMLLVGEY